MKKIYVALPYTGVEEKSFKIANQVSGAIMNLGDIPMSPISHSHPMSKECELRGDWEFWKAMDCSFIDWADEVLVLVWDEKLVEDSVGVQAEIEYARENGKIVKFLKLTPEGDWYKFDLKKVSIVKTSQEWYLIEREKRNIVIMDPDGWDRKNYEFSFNEELITEEEFNNRLGLSTCIIMKKEA